MCGESLSSTSSYAILFVRRLSRRRPPRAHRHWQNRRSVKEMRGSERSESIGDYAGATRTDSDRCRRRGGGGGGDRHHPCVPPPFSFSAMRHSTIIHDTRFLSTTQPPQTSRHARLSRRHRAAVSTSPSLFSGRRVYGRCRLARIDICDSMSVDNEESRRPGSRRSESPRQWASRNDPLSRYLSTRLPSPSIRRESVGEFSRAKSRVHSWRGGTAGKRKALKSERNSREIPIKSIWIKAIFFLL